MKLIKQDKRGRVYQTNDGFEIIYRFANTISGNNNINQKELIYLISGSARVTLENKTWKIVAPAKLEFPEKTYHKIEAISDISFILFEN